MNVETGEVFPLSMTDFSHMLMLLTSSFKKYLNCQQTKPCFGSISEL